MRVKIPFDKRFIIELAAQRKTMTTRSKRYGKIGDTFWIKHIRFQILAVVRLELIHIMSTFYREEGFRTPGEFKKFWLTIHRKWQPEKKYYLHIFRRNN